MLLFFYCRRKNKNETVGCWAFDVHTDAYSIKLTEDARTQCGVQARYVYEDNDMKGRINDNELV